MSSDDLEPEVEVGQDVVAIGVPAAADATVDASAPSSNFGAMTSIRAIGAGKEALIKFSVPASPPISKATLRLYVVGPSLNAADVYDAAAVSWSETGVTWNTRPSAGALLGSIVTAATGTWIEVDVTAAVRAGSAAGFVLRGRSSDGVSFSSRETTAPPSLVISSAGPLVSLPLNEGAGTVAADTSGNGHTAEVAGGAIWKAGVEGNALSLDGVDDRLRIPDLRYGPSLTLSFWFRVADNSGTSVQYLFGHGPSSAPNSVRVFLFEDADPTGNAGKLRTVFRDGDDSADLRLDVAAGLADNAWHLYALTVAPGRGVSVAIDGTERAATLEAGGDPVDPSGDLYLGTRPDLAASRFLKGSLDDVRLYDRALSEDELGTLYSERAGGGGGAQAVCGNSTVETGEVCDGVCCSDTCKEVLKDGAACASGVCKVGACVAPLPPTPGGTPTRYVRADGRTVVAGKPTHTTLAAAIGAAATAFAAGSTELIEVQANQAGTTQTFLESLALVNRNFAQGRELVLRSRAGDTIWVKDAPKANGGSFPLYTSGSSFFKITGRWIFGDKAGWSQSNSGRGVVANKSLLIANGTHHFELSGDITIYGGRDWEANTIDGSVYLGRLKGCHFDLAGTNFDSAGTRETNRNWGNDRSDLLTVYGDRILLEDSTFRHGGHNNISFNATRSIARRNTFDGDWTDMNTGYPGARAAAFDPALDGNWVNAPTRTAYGPILVEDNVLKNAGASYDGPQNVTMKFEGRFITFRYNLVVDSRSGAFFGGGAFYSVISKTRLAYADNYVYHNTLVNGRGIWSGNTTAYAVVNADGSKTWPFHPDSMARLKIRNNLFTDILNGNANGVDRNVFRWLHNFVPLNGHPNGWKSSEITDNIIQSSASLANVQLAQGGEAAIVSLYDSTRWPNAWARNVNTQVTFANPGTPGNRPPNWRAGFALTSGNDATKIAAPPLAKTRASGVSTTVIPVTDAGYFHDGFDMGYFGELGDTVQIGSERVVVTARDTALGASTLKVNRAISFASGAPVQLVRNGAVLTKKGAVQELP